MGLKVTRHTKCRPSVNYDEAAAVFRGLSHTPELEDFESWFGERAYTFILEKIDEMILKLEELGYDNMEYQMYVGTSSTDYNDKISESWGNRPVKQIGNFYLLTMENEMKRNGVCIDAVSIGCLPNFVESCMFQICINHITLGMLMLWENNADENSPNTDGGFTAYTYFNKQVIQHQNGYVKEDI